MVQTWWVQKWTVIHLQVASNFSSGPTAFANYPGLESMSIPRSDWRRTEMKPGTFTYRFHASAVHNPSFWEFYITKAGTDLTKPLTWDDLEAIGTQGDITPEKIGNGSEGLYSMDVTIPEGRSGDATFYVRWQRVDPAGEGFYNCSDITITDNPNNDDIKPPSPPKPGLTEGELDQGADFIDRANEEVINLEAGDTIFYDVYKVDRKKSSNWSLDYTAEYTIKEDDPIINIEGPIAPTWASTLASMVNGYYKVLNRGKNDVFIGNWDDEMKQYRFFDEDLDNNYFNSRYSESADNYKKFRGSLNVVRTPPKIKLDTSVVNRGQESKFWSSYQLIFTNNSNQTIDLNNKKMFSAVRNFN